MGARFLVEHEAVIDGQAEQDGGESGADDVQCTKPQTAEPERSGQDQGEEGHEPEEWSQAPVHPEKERCDDEQGAHDGPDHVAFHASPDLGHERGLAGEANRDFGEVGVLLLPASDGIFDFGEPALRIAIAGQG